MLKDLGNMDEVPMALDMPGSHTVDVRESQDISIATTGTFFTGHSIDKFIGAEKCNFTVVLCATGDGDKCKPMVIFKRKTIFLSCQY